MPFFSLYILYTSVHFFMNVFYPRVVGDREQTIPKPPMSERETEYQIHRRGRAKFLEPHGGIMYIGSFFYNVLRVREDS